MLVQAWQVNPTAVFLGISALLLSISLSAFLVAAIPALLVSGRVPRRRRHLLLLLPPGISPRHGHTNCTGHAAQRSGI